MSITVQCPACSSAFPVDPRKIPEKGVRVRCSRCAHVFFIERPRESSATPAEAPSPGPGASHAAPPATHRPEAPPDAPPAAPAPAEPSTAPGTPSGSVPWEPAVERPAPDWTVGAPQHEAPEAPPARHEPTPEPEPEPAAQPEVSFDPSTGSPDDWVIEREPDIDPSSLQVDRLETVEEQMRQTKESFFQGLDSSLRGAEEPASPGEAAGHREESGTAAPTRGDDAFFGERSEEEPAAPEAAPTAEADRDAPAPRRPDATEARFFGGGGSGGTELAEPPGPTPESEPTPEVSPGSAGEPEPAPAEPAAPAPSRPVTGFQFGQRDPHERARRLARVLVSDMIMYNPERHKRALERGTLKEDFEDEIKKSWEEYTDQIGGDVAESTSYFNDALNDILARGQRMF